MAIVTQQFSLAQYTPVQLVGSTNMPQEVHVHNH